MLPKSRRIQRNEFAEVISRARRYNSPSLLLYLYKTDSQKSSKFSFSVSKKVSPAATDRNRHRRRGYSVIRDSTASIAPGFLCFSSFKKGFSKIKFADLEKEILGLLSDSGVIRQESMVGLFHTFISEPFYNGFILLMDFLPFFDAGVIIIIFTIIIKIILLPLSIKASKAQLQMKSTEKDLSEIKEKYKDNREEQAKKTIEYYKEKGINPFAGIFIILIQLPILIGLYHVFLRSGLPSINVSILYDFVRSPSMVDMTFLNFVDISEKSLILALIAGITTYFQVSVASPKVAPGASQGDFAKAMATQMKYFFPIIMAFIAYTISSAVALYLITSNIFAIGQEMYIKRKYHQATLVV